jgi:hypothetical protein
MAAKVAATERLTEEASVAARARRGAFNVSQSGAGNFLGERELVADVASGRVDVATLPATELPPAVAALPPEEQRTLLAETVRKREELTQKIAALAAERDAYLEAEVEAAGGADASLDRQIYDAVREQAAPLGLDYEDGPRF